MEELSWSSTDIIPKYGDFSIISDKNIKKFLTFDHKVFLKMGADGINLIRSKKDFDTYLWKQIRTRCFHHHTDETFLCSIYVLEYIDSNGWTEFIIKCLNGF